VAMAKTTARAAIVALLSQDCVYVFFSVYVSVALFGGNGEDNDES
jgi:hypothetical protein